MPNAQLYRDLYITTIMKWKSIFHGDAGQMVLQHSRTSGNPNHQAKASGNRCLMGMVVLGILLVTAGLGAEGTYQDAVAKYKKGDWKGSIEEIRKLHDAGGNSYESHALCAYAYSKLGDFNSSSSHFFSSIKLKPSDPRVRADLIRLYLNHKKTKGALELATDAVEKFTDDPEIQFLYASTLLERGKAKSALSRVEKLKSQSPNDPELLNLEGKIYYSLGNYEKADVSLKWASALAKDSAPIWNNIALVQEKLYLSHIQSGRKKQAGDSLSEAQESIRKAVSLDAREDSISKNAERILAYSGR